MAVVHDVSNINTNAGSVSALDATVTIANVANRFAILSLTARTGSRTTSAVMLGTLSFSAFATINYSTSLTTVLYALYAPNTGTQTAHVALVNNTSFGFGLSVFNGVDQTTGYSHQFSQTGSAAAVTATISTSTTDLVLAGIMQSGGYGDGSLSVAGSTQLLSGGARRIEHHVVTPAGTTATVAYQLVAGSSEILWALNLRAVSTPPVGAPPLLTLPLTGAGPG